MSLRRSGRPVSIGGLEIEPIERVAVHVANVCGLIVGGALKEPIAIVFRSPSGTWRVDLESLAQTGVTAIETMRVPDNGNDRR